MYSSRPPGVKELAMRIASLFALSAALCSQASAVDWTQVPLTEDGTCEFRAAVWTPAFLEKHRATTLSDAEEAAIRLARQKCKDGMILLITDQSSANPKITNAAMNIARALCKVQDIERTQRQSVDKWPFTDFRCPISKIGVVDSPVRSPT